MKLVQNSDFEKLLDYSEKNLNSSVINSELSLQLVTVAEDLILSSPDTVNNTTWHNFLDVTRRPNFLKSLPDSSARYKWAEVAFLVIRHSGFVFKTMFDQRVQRHPERVLFKTTDGDKILNFSYKWVENRIKQIAALLYSLEAEPRVAIFSDNRLDSACTDLACLSYDIVNTPLNTHFGMDTLNDIFTKLKINIVLTDSETRLDLLLKLQEKTNNQFGIIYIGNNYSERIKNFSHLEKLIAGLDMHNMDSILNKRKGLAKDDIATVLFTSGSTGNAKGVAYTMNNLITKRFARAAALPDVGENELLLCYLPLYHTFGRYLELMGMIFWGGTYVFAGNPSAETLFALMTKLNPTGLISIPLRWIQIRDKFLEKTAKTTDKPLFQKIVGSKLRWGLSAAGYLDSRVFSFFQAHGVELCSGFGMTEATGGISMTPPGQYIKDSVGIPLPGIKTRLNEEDELEISGVYVAKYLDEINEDKDEHWLKTGDLFKVDDKGHLHIFDRVKDIYKNVKGQTIAPQKIEKIFELIPGFKRTFLVGDGLSYNTLLIVPDLEDPILCRYSSRRKMMDYFRPIINSANKNLAPYERIVEFAILNRDFDERSGELTAKSTYRRKVIEENFALEINRLYKYKSLELKINDIKILIPRWIIRDLGVTEKDLAISNDGLQNQCDLSFLPIKRNFKTDRIQIGDLEYIIKGSYVDLGIIVRQPLLWAGNISLIRFTYCKDGWDTPFEDISPQAFLAPKRNPGSELKSFKETNHYLEDKLNSINNIIVDALYSTGAAAIAAVQQLETALHTENFRVQHLIRRRLETLALHPEFEIRSTAYRILLFDEPTPDYSKYLPAFIDSGLPFLDKKSIGKLSQTNIDKGKLSAFRARLEAYRASLTWPASKVPLNQFKRILELLVNFARNNREYYNEVREELVNWILHKADPVLSVYARNLSDKLGLYFEASFSLSSFEKNETNWNDRTVFQDGITDDEILKIKKVMYNTTLLKEALYLIYGEQKTNLRNIKKNGIWISRILSPHNAYLYRLSINSIFEKHYDLMLLIKDNITLAAVREQIYWMIKIAGYPSGNSVLTKFGNFRYVFGTMCLAYVNELSVWEKIREYSSTKTQSISYKNELKWRTLFINAISAFFKAWLYSGKMIVPGAITPTNVVVTEPDYKESTKILSLSSWTICKDKSSLIRPIIKNFYEQTIANHPWNRAILKVQWIFDALVEALGKEEAIVFLNQLLLEIKAKSIAVSIFNLEAEIKDYITKLNSKPYIHLAVINAVERYNKWLSANQSSTAEAKEQFIKKLYWLYHLERFEEITHFILYKKTYFANSSQETKKKFDKLISTLFEHGNEPATSLIELSELQNTLKKEEDRYVFSKMVFPEVARNFKMEFTSIGEEGFTEVILKTKITDRSGKELIIRKAVSPFEVGSLYRLFILDDYPVNITSSDQFLIITDDEAQENVIGGICYNILESNVAHLEGLVVAAPFRRRGIGGRLLEDFCGRLLADGFKVVTTHFVLTGFFEKYQFKVDSHWGGLVRFLTY